MTQCFTQIHEQTVPNTLLVSPCCMVNTNLGQNIGDLEVVTLPKMLFFPREGPSNLEALLVLQTVAEPPTYWTHNTALTHRGNSLKQIINEPVTWPAQFTHVPLRLSLVNRPYIQARGLVQAGYLDCRQSDLQAQELSRNFLSHITVNFEKLEGMIFQDYSANMRPTWAMLHTRV